MAATKSDKRTNDRSRKRLRVRYGVERLEKTAFTKNISETGVYLQTNQVYAPGTTLQLEIDFPGRAVGLWARVVWAKKVPPQLAHVLECGMGLCFIDPGADWYQFFSQWQKERGEG